MQVVLYAVYWMSIFVLLHVNKFRLWKFNLYNISCTHSFTSFDSIVWLVWLQLKLLKKSLTRGGR